MRRRRLPGMTVLAARKATLRAITIAAAFCTPAAAHADATLPLPLSGAPYRIAREALDAFNQHRYVDAAASAREAIRQRPDVAGLRLLLANSLAARGHLKDASRVLSDAIAQLGPQPALVMRRHQIDTLIAGGGEGGGVGDLQGPALQSARAAYRDFARKDYAAAVSEAREAVRLAPKVERLRYLLVDALAASGDDPAAYAAADDAAHRFGDSEGLRMRRRYIGERLAPAESRAAFAARENGDLDEAERRAWHAVAYAPDRADFRMQLVETLFARGDLAGVEHASSDAIALDRDDPLWWTLRGYARAARGANEGADADFAHALAVAPDSWQQARDTRANLNAPPDADPADQENAESTDIDTAIDVHEADEARRARDESIRRFGVEHPNAMSVDEERSTVMQLNLERARAAANSAEQSPAASANTTAQPTSPSAQVAQRRYRDARVARTIIADVRLAQGKPQAALDALPRVTQAQRGTAPDDADAAVALRRHRAQTMLSNAGVAAKTPDPAARPAFDCREDRYGASCDVYAHDPALLSTRAARIAQQQGDRKAAIDDWKQAVQAVPDDPQLRIALIDALAADGQTRAASDEARAVIDEHLLDSMSDLQAAFIAQRAGDRTLALEHFTRAEQQGKVPASAEADAGYAALALHRRDEGVTFLERAIDDTPNAPPGQALSPLSLYDARSAHAEATRNWGFTASVNYRGNGGQPGFASTPTPGLSNNWQTGAEAYWRPFGSLGDRMFEVYARAFENFGVQGGGPSGASTLEAAIGARVKPFASVNAVFAIEKILPIGSDVRSDWLARAAYSTGFGDARRLDVPSWWTGTFYGEMGHYLVHSSTYATAQARLGRTYRVDGITPRLTVFPHLVAGVDYDSAIDHSTPVGIGAGVAARYWFRGGPYDAPRSFVDLSVQYRFRVAGDDRAKGVFFGAVFSY
jgi:tetratricopeptide (TPR) repeat protein